VPCRHFTSTAALATGAPVAAVPLMEAPGGVPPPPPPPPHAERNKASTHGNRKFRMATSFSRLQHRPAVAGRTSHRKRNEYAGLDWRSKHCRSVTRKD